jgi:hypothetical protein
MDITERLCRSLAFHLVESEITLSVATGDLSEWKSQVASARALIEAAGFDIDELYPIAERPTVSSLQ